MHRECDMKNLFLFFALITLISCTAENNTANPINFINCDTSALVSGSPNANEIVVTVSSNRRALVNAVVQLDDSGLCLKTDANGRVLFTNVSSGAHDIHVFGLSGFDWQSIYNINAALGVTENVSLFNRSQLIVSDPKPLYNSYINLTGSITTKTPGNEVFLFVLFDKSSLLIKEKSSVLLTQFNLQYGFLNDFPTNDAIPVGTPVTVDLWAFEYTKNSLGETVLIDAVQSTLSLDTTSESAIANVQDVTFNSQSLLPVEVELLTFGGNTTTVAAPTGLTMTDISLSSSDNTFNSIPLLLAEQNDLAINSSYSITIPQLLADKLTAIKFSIRASVSNAQGRTTWLFGTGGIAVAANVNVTPQPTPILTVSGFSNGLFSWSSATKIPESRRIIINHNLQSTPEWLIKIKGDSNTVNSITLPSLPEGLAPILVKGKRYETLFRSTFYYDNNNNPVREIFSTRVSQVY